jgi:hypothetical protein
MIPILDQIYQHLQQKTIGMEHQHQQQHQQRHFPSVLIVRNRMPLAIELDRCYETYEQVKHPRWHFKQ